MSSCSRSCARSETARARGAVPALVALVAAAAFAAASWAAPGDWSLVEERWYRLYLGGQPCGWFRETLERSGDSFRSGTETEMTVGRMGQGVTVRTRSTFEETADGRPLGARIRRDTGAAPVESEWAFRDGELVVTESQGVAAPSSGGRCRPRAGSRRARRTCSCARAWRPARRSSATSPSTPRAAPMP